MVKEMFDGLRGAFGAIAGAISVGTAIVGLSITTIATALFWGAVGFAGVITLVVTITLVVMTHRDPEIKTEVGVKVTLNALFAGLFVTLALFNAGYRDTGHFGITQMIGIPLLAATVVLGAAVWVSTWTDRHGRCTNCKGWIVIEAVGCRHCLTDRPFG